MTIAPAWPRKTIRLLTRVTIFRHTRETTQALYLFCLYTSPLLLMNLVVCFISRCGSLESNGSFFKTCDQPVTLLRTRKKKKETVCVVGMELGSMQKAYSNSLKEAAAETISETQACRVACSGPRVLSTKDDSSRQTRVAKLLYYTWLPNTWGVDKLGILFATISRTKKAVASSKRQPWYLPQQMFNAEC